MKRGERWGDRGTFAWGQYKEPKDDLGTARGVIKGWLWAFAGSSLFALLTFLVLLWVTQ